MSRAGMVVLQKPPEELIVKFEREELMRILFVRDKVDVGVTMMQVVRENLPALLRQLGVEYDEVEVYPSAHPTWKSDIMVYRRGKVVLRISLKTCEMAERIVDAIYRLKVGLRDDEHGLLCVAAGYKRSRDEPERLGFLLIFMSNDYLRRRSPEQIHQEILDEVERIREREGLYWLRLANARDLMVVESWVTVMRLYALQRVMLRNQEQMLQNQREMIAILREILSELRALRRALERTP